MEIKPIRSALGLLVLGSLLLPFGTAGAQASAAKVEEEAPLTLPIRNLTMEAATKMAQATIEACRKEGYAIAVTVVDRGGHPQVMLRDTVSPDLTLTISEQKAYTAMSFNTATSELENRFSSPFSVGKVEGLVMSAGGLPVEAGGQILGGIGVSGGPTGKVDELCARAGLDAVSGDLELSL